MEENLKIGFSRVDITPPLGAEINGYPNLRLAEDVLDPLYINAVAFSEGENKAVMLVCDTLGIYGPLADELPGMIAEHCGISDEGVFVCHTHTHTGFLISQYGVEVDPFIVEFFCRRIKDAAKMAINDLKDVKSASFGEGEAPYTFSRRYKLKDGTYRTNGKALDPLVEGFEAPFDQSMRIVKFVREGGEDIVLANWQSHPDNIGKCKITADFPGIFRNLFEREHSNTKCVYINGGEGNMICNDKVHCPKSVGYEKIIEIAENLNKSANDILKNLKDLETEGLSAAKVYVCAKTKYSPEKLKEAIRIKKCYEEGRMEDIGDNPKERLPKVIEANNIIAIGSKKITEINLRVSAIRFGGLSLLGLPGEPFCETAEKIRKNSPSTVTFVACQTNGSHGYLPNEEQWEHGGYEPFSTRTVKGTEERVRAAAEKLLKEM